MLIKAVYVWSVRQRGYPPLTYEGSIKIRFFGIYFLRFASGFQNEKKILLRPPCAFGCDGQRTAAKELSEERRKERTKIIKNILLCTYLV